MAKRKPQLKGMKMGKRKESRLKKKWKRRARIRNKGKTVRKALLRHMHCNWPRGRDTCYTVGAPARRGGERNHSWAKRLISCKRICIQFGQQSSPDGPASGQGYDEDEVDREKKKGTGHLITRYGRP